MFAADFGGVSHVVRFQDDERIVRGSKINLQGVPFMIVGCKFLECHQGPKHDKQHKNKVCSTSLRCLLVYNLLSSFLQSNDAINKKYFTYFIPVHCTHLHSHNVSFKVVEMNV
jgi:hypothetical protein